MKIQLQIKRAILSYSKNEESQVANGDQNELQKANAKEHDIGDENLEYDIVEDEEATNIQLSDIQWGLVDQNFSSRKTVSMDREYLPTEDIDRSSRKLFLTFPLNLTYLHIGLQKQTFGDAEE